jgi:phosphopantetheinyl transferase
MLLALGSACLKKRFAGESIKISPLGKPCAGGVFFSVSHCEELAGIALSDGREVGLDIESNAASCEETADYCFMEYSRKDGKNVLTVIKKAKK